MPLGAIVVCSCGWKTGTVFRSATLDGDPLTEALLLRAQVPRMVRHWALGHRLKGAVEYRTIIVEEALKLRWKRDDFERAARRDI